MEEPYQFCRLERGRHSRDFEEFVLLIVEIYSIAPECSDRKILVLFFQCIIRRGGVCPGDD